MAHKLTISFQLCIQQIINFQWSPRNRPDVTRRSPRGWGMGSIMSTVDRASFLSAHQTWVLFTRRSRQPGWRRCRPTTPRAGQDMSRRTDHINSINSQQLVVDCGVYLYQYQCCNKNMWAMSASRHFYDSNPDIQYSTVGWEFSILMDATNNERWLYSLIIEVCKVVALFYDWSVWEWDGQASRFPLDS